MKVIEVYSMIEGDSEYDFSQPPNSSEYESPTVEFKTYVDKRAELLESIGLIYFDPKQIQWRRDADRQSGELLKEFRQVLMQIYNNAKSDTEFVLKVADFMVSDRLERAKFATNFRGRLVPIAFSKKELQDKLAHLYSHTSNWPLLMSRIELLFQGDLQTDFNYAIATTSGPTQTS